LQIQSQISDCRFNRTISDQSQISVSDFIEGTMQAISNLNKNLKSAI